MLKELAYDVDRIINEHVCGKLTEAAAAAAICKIMEQFPRNLLNRAGVRFYVFERIQKSTFENHDTLALRVHEGYQL